MEVKSIIEAYEMKAMGGLVAAWELWERALLPSLLSGAGTWLGRIEETVKLCNSIQYFYWRLVLNVPESCPKLALLCESNSIDMKFHIWNAKCQLLVRIKRLEEEALAKQVYKQAEDSGWPGLGEEVRSICEQIQIPDINKYEVQKQEIHDAIFEAHYSSMISQFSTSKKLQDIKDDNFRQMQEYFKDKNLSNARLKFKIRSKMVDRIPGNFKNRYKYSEEGLNCTDCMVELTQDHCVICPSRASLREDLDMSRLDDTVIYFKRYLAFEKTK
jgi:hypothetical protein